MSEKRALAILSVLVVAFALFCAPVNAANIAIEGYKSAQWTNDTGTRVTMFVTELYPPNGDIVIESMQNYTIVHKTLLVQVKLSNLTSQTRYFYDFWPKFELSVPNAGNGVVTYAACTDVVNYSTDFMLTFNDTDSYIEYTPSVDFSFLGNPCVPANSTLVALAKMEFAVTVRIDTSTSSGMAYNECHVSSVSIYNNTYESPVTDFCPVGSHQDLNDALGLLHSDLLNSGYGLPAIENTLEEIRDLLQDIHDSIGSSDYSDTIDDSDDLQTTEAAIHAQEQQWYTENQTAIEATGLGNYQYSQGLIDSFGAARYQIAQVWNALADWTYVYYLVFLLGLATYILRHEPSMRAKQLRDDAEISKIYRDAGRSVRYSRDEDYRRAVIRIGRKRGRL